MLITHAGYADRIVIDASVVRGLEYYTGPVFEAELTAPITDDKGQPIRLGSVVSGGRYDGLVERFTGEKVPATGISIGVSRLLFGLQRLGKYKESATQGPVVVLVLDRDRIADYQKMAQRPARRRHPRRALSRRVRHEGADEICRQARQPLRRHPGRRREGQRRGADQGPDPRRHAHLDQGPRRLSEKAGRGTVRRAGSAARRGRPGVLARHKA